MKPNLLFAISICLALAACGKSDPKPSPKPAAGENPLTAPVDYLGAMGKAHKSAQTRVDLASVQQAIQMFHAQEGRFPKTLEELVREGYLPRLAAPPAGSRLFYNPANGEVRILRQ